MTVFDGQNPPQVSELSEKDELTFGRADSCDIVVSSHLVSGKHGLITRQDDSFAITDIGSTNGILFDGDFINNRQLSDCDIVRVDDFKNALPEGVLLFFVIGHKKPEWKTIPAEGNVYMGFDSGEMIVGGKDDIANTLAELCFENGVNTVKRRNPRADVRINGKKLEISAVIGEKDVIRAGTCIMVITGNRLNYFRLESQTASQPTRPADVPQPLPFIKAAEDVKADDKTLTDKPLISGYDHNQREVLNHVGHEHGETAPVSEASPKRNPGKTDGISADAFKNAAIGQPVNTDKNTAPPPAVPRPSYINAPAGQINPGTARPSAAAPVKNKPGNMSGIRLAVIIVSAFLIWGGMILGCFKAPAISVLMILPAAVFGWGFFGKILGNEKTPDKIALRGILGLLTGIFTAPFEIADWISGLLS